MPDLSQGLTVWLTGLPSAGKTTIAHALEKRLLAAGHRVEVLDGDVARTHLTRGLGFSREDREENVRRIGYVAKLLSRNGVIALCVAVSPYRAMREEVRRNVTNFIEIFVDIPVEVAERRDAEGLYARARLGDIEDFTGVNAPYESPLHPDVHIHADRESVDEAALKVVKTLESRGIIPPVTDGELPPDVEEEMKRRLSELGFR